MVRKKSQHSICFPLLIWIELSNLWGDLSVQQGGMLIGIKDKQEKQQNPRVEILSKTMWQEVLWFILFVRQVKVEAIVDQQINTLHITGKSQVLKPRQLYVINGNYWTYVNISYRFLWKGRPAQLIFIITQCFLICIECKLRQSLTNELIILVKVEDFKFDVLTFYE